MEDIKLFKKLLFDKSYLNFETVLFVTAGFEDRCAAIFFLLQEYDQKIDKIVIIDYEDKISNEPARSKLISYAKNVSNESFLLDSNAIAAYIENEIWLHNKKVLIDITGMSRVVMFEFLYHCDKQNILYDIIYTEAENYFPQKQFFERLIANTKFKEDAFINYLEIKESELVYSYNCDIIQPKEFAGDLEPGKPSMLLTFFTFKRSRLQRLLQEFEFDNKLIVLSEPVRDDLKWRKEFMEIANYDLIQKNSPNIKILQTLNPFITLQYLNKETYDNRLYVRYNLFLAPLGSKMQTMGAYFYWRSHPETPVIFSQPLFYYQRTYSESYRDTFVLTSDVISKNLMLEQ